MAKATQRAQIFFPCLSNIRSAQSEQTTRQSSSFKCWRNITSTLPSCKRWVATIPTLTPTIQTPKYFQISYAVFRPQPPSSPFGAMENDLPATKRAPPTTFSSLRNTSRLSSLCAQNSSTLAEQVRTQFLSARDANIKYLFEVSWPRWMESPPSSSWGLLKNRYSSPNKPRTNRKKFSIATINFRQIQIRAALPPSI